MLFVGFALLIAIGLALLISGEGGHFFGLSPQETGQALPIVVLLIFLAASLFMRRRRFSEILGNFVAWIVIFGVVLVGYAYRNDLSDVASRVVGELMPGQAVVDAEKGTVTFRRGRGGHFQVNAEINGARVPLIFDTGASAVVLTTEDARAAGIDVDALSYSMPVSTANGTGRAAIVMLDSMDVGGIVRRKARAFVAEPGVLDVSLLGMTFLETLDHYTVTSGGLELAG
jgi:aspartyl protease family protein